MKSSYKVFGSKITNSIMKRTFFGHFCAGENEYDIKPTVDYLQKNGVGSILDYAAEADIVENVEDDTKKDLQIATKDNVQCRVYDYKDEQLCDMHAKTFEKCIRAVHAVSPTGFAAIKCTALGNPELLKRASAALNALRGLFLKFDTSGTGLVNKTEFIAAYDKYFKSGDANAVFAKCDTYKDGKVDYIEWTNELTLEELHTLTSHCRESGPLSQSILDENERLLMRSMRERINNLAFLAQSLGVRLMIDAEHTYFQPAIDNLTAGLMKTFNKSDFPVIFGTYQMYLTDSRSRLFTDIERASKGNYKFAAKLVRGAYMVLERDYAYKMDLPDPIHPSVDATHRNYNSTVRDVIEKIGACKSGDIEVMIASHNQSSVEQALQAMQDFHVSPSQGVYFGQLLGMSDNITFNLGNSGFKAYKYVPYGKVNEVMPYLIRRAQENSDALSGAKMELELVSKEIRRRIFGF